MDLVLSKFGTTFATRERARQLATSLDVGDDRREVNVNLSGVSTASPSFLAELLTHLANRFVGISVEGGSDHVQRVTFSLVEKLGLTGRVREVASR